MPATTLDPAKPVAAPTTPEPKPSPTPTDAIERQVETLTQQADRIQRQFEGLRTDLRKTAEERQRTLRESYTREVKPAAEAVAGAATAPLPPAPEMEPTARVPEERLKMRPFLSSPDAKGALTTAITGLGMLAQLVAGVVAQAPVAGLGALTGAMNGWAEGDHERAERDWRVYLATVDRIREDNATAQRAWENAMRLHGANMEAAKAAYTLRLGELEFSEKLAALAQGDMATALQLNQAEQTALGRVEAATRGLIQMKATDELRWQTAEWANLYRAGMLEVARGKLAEEKRTNDLIMNLVGGAGKGPGGTNTSVDNLARQIVAGRTPTELGIPRWGKWAAFGIAVQDRAVELMREEGKGPEALTLAAANKKANQQALVKLTSEYADFQGFLGSFEKALETTRTLSAKVDRTQSPWVNRAELWVRANVGGDSDAKNLIAQMEVLANEAQRVLSRAKGVGSETSREHARDLFNPGMTKENFESLLTHVLEADAQNARAGFTDAIATYQRALATPIAPPSGGPSPPALVPPRSAHRDQQGNIVSDSGKYIWRDGQWQPK